MWLFLYNLPSYQMGLIVVGTVLAAALVGYALFRRLLPVHFDAEQRALALAMMAAVTTINSLLVAFSAISVWGTFDATAAAVDAEAGSASELAADLAAFGRADADAARDALIVYLQRVVHDEWPQMQQHARSDPGSTHAFDRMFKAVNRIEPQDERQRVLLGEILARVNEMAKRREQRLVHVDEHMPLALWSVMLIASGLSFLLLYGLPATHFHVGLVAIWAITLGLAFFFVLAVDRPFAGEVSVSAAPLQHAIDTMTDLDERALAPRP